MNSSDQGKDITLLSKTDSSLCFKLKIDVASSKVFYDKYDENCYVLFRCTSYESCANKKLYIGVSIILSKAYYMKLRQKGLPFEFVFDLSRASSSTKEKTKKYQLNDECKVEIIFKHKKVFNRAHYSGNSLKNSPYRIDKLFHY